MDNNLMPAMSAISTAFVKAQRKFAPALKSATNPHFKSKYADLSACIEAVIDALNVEGIALMQHTRVSDSGVIVETVFLHESGERILCGELHVPASKQDPQGYGSALTYARRYSLMAACGIAPEDDDGNKGSEKISADQAANLRALAQEVGADITAFCKFFGVDKLESLPATQFAKAISALEKKRKNTTA